MPSVQSSSRNENCVNTSEILLKNMNWTFHEGCYFTWKLVFVSNIFCIIYIFFSFFYTFFKVFPYLRYFFYFIDTFYSIVWFALFSAECNYTCISLWFSCFKFAVHSFNGFVSFRNFFSEIHCDFAGCEFLDFVEPFIHWL